MRPGSWVPFLLLCFILGAVLHSPILLSLGFTLAMILAVAGWWRKHSLDEVSYRRGWHYHRGFPGEQVPLRIEVENRKILPLTWLSTTDAWPKAVGPDDLSILAPSHITDEGILTHRFSMRWYERACREYTLTLRQRGYYRIGPVTLSSGDLFGIYEEKRTVSNADALTVFPEVLPFTELKLQTDDPFGDRRSRRRLFEDPNRPMGVRDYHPEDGFRRVHWPATARTGQIMVKVFQPVSTQELVVCLNVATFPHYWEGVYPALLEQLIKVAATLIYYSVQDGYSVGLISNGCLAHADQPFHIPPGRSPKQLARLLQALAEVTPFITAPFEKYLLKSAPSIPYGATLILVTGIVTADLADTLVRLKKYRRNMTLISLAEPAPPAIAGIRAVHLPFAG